MEKEEIIQTLQADIASLKAQNYYFPHDSNSRNDDKIIAVRQRYGMEGYGIYFGILERIREAAGYMHVKDYSIIAFELHTDESVVRSVVEDFGLFTFTDDGEAFYSLSFMCRMQPLENMRRQRRMAARKSVESRMKQKAADENPATVERPLNECLTNKSKVKKKKEKEKNKDIKQGLPAGKTLVEEYIGQFNRIRKSRFRVTEKVSRQFAARVREGFTCAEMIAALQIAMTSKHHIDHNFVYLTPEFFTRSDKLQTYLNMNSDAGNTPVKECTWTCAGSLRTGSYGQYLDDVKRMGKENVGAMNSNS